MLTVNKTSLSVIQANRSARLYTVNHNLTQDTLKKTQVSCLQLALVNGSKQNNMYIQTSAVCGLHSTLGGILPPVRRIESAVCVFD